MHIPGKYPRKRRKKEILTAMSECTHECSTCGESCSERQAPQSLLKELNPAARVGKVYGVVSGKGGVG